jgi:hypothetical protein
VSSITIKLPPGQCGGFTEINNKGSYHWNSSKSDETLNCTYNESKTARAKCVCDSTKVILMMFQHVFYFLKADNPILIPFF